MPVRVSRASIGAANMLYGNGVADIVNPMNINAGRVSWGGQNGNYFGSGTLARVADPQCAEVARNDHHRVCDPSVRCRPITETSTGQILYPNPRPGTRGTAGLRTVSLPGTGVSIRR
jgi:hypothetical protein